ncbi:MAG: hypothetical protein ACLFOY_07840 [Desulfatibacillaceae bacterium]
MWFSSAIRYALFCLFVVLTFLSGFAASRAMAAELDGEGMVTVGDAVVALKVAAGLLPSSMVFADVDNDGAIGLQEALSALQIAAYLRTAPANPLSITISADHGRVTSALATISQGATLTTTAADGAAYTLWIPPTALLADETITMTPVVSIQGIEFDGGLLCGVQLAPAGLAMLTPATLTVSLANPVTEAELINVAFRGEGRETFLSRANLPNSTTLVVPISHFSGTAAGSGSDGNRTVVTGSTPTQPQDQWSQAGENLLNDAKNQGRMPTPEEWEPLFRKWYQESIKPKANAGETDENVLPCAIVEFMRWDREMSTIARELLDDFATEREQTLVTLGRGMVNAFDNMETRCHEDKDPNEAGNMLRLSREARCLLMFMDVYEKYPEFDQVFNLDAVLAKMRDCLRFEVGFDSTLDHVFVDSGCSARTRYTATSTVVPMEEYPYPLRDFTADPATVSDAYDCPDMHDTYGFDGEFTARYLHLVIHSKPLRCGEDAVPYQYPAVGVLMYYPFPVNPNALGMNPLFGVYMATHQDDFETDDAMVQFLGPHYIVRDFTPGEGDILLQKTVSQIDNLGDEVVSEETLFTIKHVPQKSAP